MTNKLSLKICIILIIALSYIFILVKIVLLFTTNKKIIEQPQSQTEFTKYNHLANDDTTIDLDKNYKSEILNFFQHNFTKEFVNFFGQHNNVKKYSAIELNIIRLSLNILFCLQESRSFIGLRPQSKNLYNLNNSTSTNHEDQTCRIYNYIFCNYSFSEDDKIHFKFLSIFFKVVKFYNSTTLPFNLFTFTLSILVEYQDTKNLQPTLMKKNEENMFLELKIIDSDIIFHCSESILNKNNSDYEILSFLDFFSKRYLSFVILDMDDRNKLIQEFKNLDKIRYDIFYINHIYKLVNIICISFLLDKYFLFIPVEKTIYVIHINKRFTTKLENFLKILSNENYFIYFIFKKIA